MLRRLVMFPSTNPISGAAIDARLTPDRGKSILRVIHAFIFNGYIEVRTSYWGSDAQLELP